MQRSNSPAVPEARGMSRRTFLAAVALSGGAVALAACAGATPTPAPAPPAAPTPAPTVAPPASPTSAPAAPTAPAGQAPAPAPTAAPAAQRLIDKPIPPEFFIPFGSNAEMRFEVMANRGLTVPNSFFFVRNHQAAAVVDLKTWKLSIEGSGVSKPFTLTYDELLKLPAKTITRFVECAGNGRSFFQTFLNKPAQGTQWHLGAYGVAEWTGVPLSELLDRAGIKASATEVMPIGLDQPQVRRPMPVARAMAEDTLLVYMMNGNILPIDHGFPARVLVPGWVGVSSVKWVGTIAVTEEHNAVPWNTSLYVLIGPDYQPESAAKGPLVTEQVLKSALALPWPATLKAGSQKITGYAWSPNGKIARVEVSLDDGKTFAPAQLVEPNLERAGVRWEFTLNAQPGDMTIMPRATDEKGNTQPSIPQQKWNEQGYLFGAAVPHPVKVTG